MCSNVFTMFAGFCCHADKNHIYTVLTVTTDPLRENIRKLLERGVSIALCGELPVRLLI